MHPIKPAERNLQWSCLKQQCWFLHYLVCERHWQTFRRTAQPIPAHRAWLREKQNNYLQLHTKKEKKEQLLRILQEKIEEILMTQRKETTGWVVARKTGQGNDAEASYLNDIVKKRRLPPWVENSGYQKSHSPPGRSWDAFPGPEYRHSPCRHHIRALSVRGGGFIVLS